MVKTLHMSKKNTTFAAAKVCGLTKKSIIWLITNGVLRMWVV